ncbi:MAG: hypothetical protein HG453_003165 [Clostridiales bacterium]|nr:hypothetical protein [Clostridiales bacterium]
MSFFSRNKNMNSSMYFISDLDEEKDLKNDDMNFKIRTVLIILDVLAFIIFLILFNNIVLCNGRCRKYAKVDSWKLQELMAQSGLVQNLNEIKSITDLPNPIYNSNSVLIKGKYKVRVNKTKNVVIVYEKGDDGKYQKSVKVMSAIVGRDIRVNTEYNIGDRWLWIKNQNGNYSKFVTQVSGNVVFESIAYKKKGDLSSLNYVEFDNLGNSIDGSFIKLQYADAQWIFDNLDYDTIVEFYESEDLNGVNVPEVKKISLENDKKNWDPTYTGSESPWNKVKNDGKKK